MTPSLVLWAVLWFAVKHAIIDFPLQPRYMWANKGTYGHPGGILHAFVHAVGTMVVVACMPVSAVFVLLAGVADAVVHYHVDYCKMNINKRLGWGPTTHEEFWWLVGLDQLLHSLTYIAIIALMI